MVLFPADLDEGVLFCYDLLFTIMYRPVVFYQMVYCVIEDVLYTLIQIGRFATGSIVSMLCAVVCYIILLCAVL